MSNSSFISQVRYSGLFVSISISILLSQQVRNTELSSGIIRAFESDGICLNHMDQCMEGNGGFGHCRLPQTTLCQNSRVTHSVTGASVGPIDFYSDMLTAKCVLTAKLNALSFFTVVSTTGKVDVSFGESYKNHDSRCVRRNDLLQTLARELPPETIRYSSKVVSIDVLGSSKLVQLADGHVVRCKILIGCDGINSVVAKWLGLQNPINTGRLAIRGFVDFPDHGFQPKFHVHFRNGVRMGFIPCDANTFYWFCTFKQTDANWQEDMSQSPDQLKSFVLRKAEDMPKELSDIVERTNSDLISAASLKLRFPWDIYTKAIAKNGISVAGVAFHPMTPDLGQGGCSALEDGVVLAKCIGESLLKTSCADVKVENEAKTTKEINKCLENYVKERRWRCASLTTVSYLNGFIQDSDSKVISFFKERFLSKYIPSILLKMADFDCGKLVSSPP